LQLGQTEVGGAAIEGGGGGGGGTIGAGAGTSTDLFSRITSSID